MQAYTWKIQDTARRLLSQNDVEAVIGFRKGTVPMTCQPVLVASPNDVGVLYWDSFCGVNLANYLPRRQGKVAIVAKGCDARNIVVHTLEHQVKRDQLYILGIPCQGMADRRKILEGVGNRDPREVTEQGETIVVKGKGFEQAFVKEDILQDNCAICVHRNPVVFDEMMGDTVAERQGIDRYEDVRLVEAMDTNGRWQHFQDLVATCIRCYACRDACPLCYCPTCFVDESCPQWVGKGVDPTDTLTFHLLRAFHCAGRCTDCGACERACPMDIEMRQFTKKLEKDVMDLFGHEAGMDPDIRPPLDLYRPDDPDDFVL
jgi:ferredoxin